MTDEQLQRIHNIEYSCDSREELAERIVGLEDELAKWERLTAGVELPDYPITEFQPKDLERENAKLRELVSEIWSACPSNEDDCKKCPHHTGESVEDWCDFPIRMRELGIEVD